MVSEYRPNDELAEDGQIVGTYGSASVFNVPMEGEYEVPLPLAILTWVLFILYGLLAGGIWVRFIA